jgi:predicted O-linked N-acetylglucosamine transferase (SPINDLY family)
MGVPVVTLVGRTAIGRGGLSQLINLGLTELIAHTPTNVADIASSLAADLSRVAFLRATLRNRLRSSPLMDAPRFARSLEATLRRLWHRWCCT